MELSFSVDVGLAPYSCSSCRARKRKCDRVRPFCGLCSKSSWTCQYKKRKFILEEKEHVTPNTIQHSLDTGVLILGKEDLRTPDFPPVYFLNANLFHRAGMKLPSPDITVPEYVQDLIGDAKAQRAITLNFFEGVNSYFPIISRTRLYNCALNPLVKLHADAALLLLAMKLAALDYSGNKKMSATPEYLAATRFQNSVEASLMCSVQFLQASILICLYEFGHAIYPSAYYSIAKAARYGIAFGIDRLDPGFGVLGDDWIEAEEKRRAWWTILILDRCVNLGNPTRQLSTQDPLPSSLLPVDDASWEKEIAPTASPFAFGPSTLSMGKFARFAQAICLLGRAYRHVSDRTTDVKFLEEEAEQLCKTLKALVDLVEIESQSNGLANKIEYCTQTAVCYCALLLLRETYHDRLLISSLELKYALSTTIASVAAVGVNIARVVTSQVPAAAVNQVSPFILHFIYQCAVFHMEHSKDHIDDHMAVESLKELFMSLRRRWGAAAAYLEIIYAHELMLSI